MYLFWMGWIVKAWLWTKAKFTCCNNYGFTVDNLNSIIFVDMAFLHFGPNFNHFSKCEMYDWGKAFCSENYSNWWIIYWSISEAGEFGKNFLVEGKKKKDIYIYKKHFWNTKWQNEQTLTKLTFTFTSAENFWME